MTRMINISTDVFAAIWAQRKPGEETEEAILRRLLDVAGERGMAMPAASSEGGVRDTRNNVHFHEGFEAFRIYKRREYRALATNGVWVRQDTGEPYPTLNQLNESITAGNENIWNGNWKYRHSDGSFRALDALRH